MGLSERLHTIWTELQGGGRLLQGLPVLNPLGHQGCARLLQALAANAPHQVGLAYQRDRFTWREIHRRANQYAHFGVRARLQRGDVVAVLMDNRPDYLLLTSGLNRIGVVSALINTHLTDAALVHALTIAKPKALVVGSEHLRVIDAILPKLPHLSKERNVWVQCDPDQEERCPGFRVINAEVAACSTEEPRRGFPETRAPMCYVYTSGTTGLPKAAIIRNQRWLEAGLILGRVVGEMTPRDVLYLTLPLYHSAGFIAAWGSVLMSGATLALRRKFSASHFWEDVHVFDATVFIYIGELCRYLLRQPPAPHERDHHIRLCMGNGLRADIWRTFQSRFRIPLIREYYGATEGNMGLVNMEGRPGMIGRLLPFEAIVKCDALTGEILRDGDGWCMSAAVGERGVFLGRINPLTSFHGYLDRVATRKKIVRNVFSKGDAYFNSGDLVQLHADRWVSFADRIGDTFRWKGENVSTHEVAEILSQAKGLQEVNVYGVTVNGAEGRVGMASLVVSEDFDLTAFAGCVVGNLAKYQRPYFLRMVPSMRVTGTFKHQKHHYRSEGYDPSTVKDPLYYLDGRQYVPLDQALYRRLAAGEIGPP